MSAPKVELDRLAMLMMVALCATWGAQQVFVKLGNEGISPLWQSALRSIGACVLVFAWARLRGVKLFKHDTTLWPGLLAGMLFAVEFALLFSALQFTSASRGVIFLYTAPFFVALGARWLLPGESMRRAQWTGMALAFSGVLALFGENLLLPMGDAWIGDLMILVAAILWAATTLTIKASVLARVAAEKTVLYQLAVSALVLPVMAVMMGEPGVFAPTMLVWVSLGFQIVVIATASYLAWFWLIRHYPATRLSSFSFLTPVLGVLAGVAFLNEPFTPLIMLALILVGAGIWVANRPQKRAIQKASE